MLSVAALFALTIGIVGLVGWGWFDRGPRDHWGDLNPERFAVGFVGVLILLGAVISFVGHVPATYWFGRPVHAASTNPAGSLGRQVGLFVDHFLPGDFTADHILGLNRPLPFTSGNTALDETVTIGGWLLVLAGGSYLAWDYLGGTGQ